MVVLRYFQREMRSLITLLLLVSLSPARHAALADGVLQSRPNRGMAQRLEKRRAEETKAAQDSKAFRDFKFTDQVDSSGITFRDGRIEEALKHMRPTHYDHGCGVAVADIDGDGLTDIYFVTQLGTNALYRNLGGGKFEDITEKAGVGLANQMCVSASFGDIDNDGLPDLYVTTTRFGNHLFHNLGGGKFKDITLEAGLAYSGHSSTAVFVDFDNDGLLDILLCNVGVFTTEQKGPGGFYRGVTNAFEGHLYPERTEYSVLYKNLGNNKFRDVTHEMGLQFRSWSGDATIVDFNEDGFPDLYVLNMQGDNHYFENQGGKRFVDKTAALFPKTPWGAMGVKSFDFNQDGRMDLLVTDMHSDMTTLQTVAGLRDVSASFEKAKSDVWCGQQWGGRVIQGTNNIFGNAFWVNQGGGKFEELSDRLGVETYWPWGVSVADLNADGYEDIFVTAGMGYPFRYGMNTLLLNEYGQKFIEAEFALGIEPRAGGGVKGLFTLDCDGADKGDPRCAGETGRLIVRGSLASRSSAIFDLDNDGDLDIVTSENSDRPQVLISNLSTRRQIHFLKVKLVGTVSNRQGLGALVQLRAAGRVHTQFNDGKTGYLSQGDIPLYFGLDSATNVEEINVRWPSGQRSSITNLSSINRQIVITEPPRSPGGHPGGG